MDCRGNATFTLATVPRCLCKQLDSTSDVQKLKKDIIGVNGKLPNFLNGIHLAAFLRWARILTIRAPIPMGSISSDLSLVSVSTNACAVGERTWFLR